MQTATLILAGIGAITGTASLLIMAKTAKELQNTKTQVDAEVADVKRKMARNSTVIKNAISNLEL